MHLSLPHPTQSPLRYALHHPIRALRERGATEPAQADLFDPDVDLVETPEGWTLRADLPGVPERALDIHFEEGALLLAGERDAERELQDAQLLVQERSWGAFARSFALPDDADPERAEADLDEGVLTVHIPRRSAAIPLHVSVRES